MATDDKYDRQLRLWGSHGQKALMDAKICMLGSTAVATEALKNLVLPGVGHFTIVDGAKVEAADLGHSFFLEEGDVGKLRAEAVCRNLLEMNPDVQGCHIGTEPAQAIAQGVGFFKPFTIVIACQLTEKLALQLGAVCHQLEIPLMLITSVGFIGKLRLAFSEHCVCETKPDSELGDLRATDPFPELRRFADSVDIDSLDDAQHAHVPYVVILIRALDIFRKQNAGKTLPASKEEKEAFKKIISDMQRSDLEANFDEAKANAYKAWVPYSIPEPVQKVLAGPKGADGKSDFWIVARALSQFVRDCGKLPLAGSLPDMTASTDMYVRLQEIYGSRAEGDCAAITAHAATILGELGASRTVPPEYIKRFCQNAQYAEVFSHRTLEEEFRPCSPEEGGVDLEGECGDEDSLIHWYLALRAADHFREAQGHWPGETCGDGEEALVADLAALTAAAARVVETYKVEGVTVDPKMLEEVVRYGGCELHVVSSVMGGIAAQEAVKIVTRQYSPLNNTLIYDGLHGKMQTIEL